jgi:diacylglycerol kinase family enzyme
MAGISHPETKPSTARHAAPPPSAARSILLNMNPRAGSRNRQKHVAEIANTLIAAGYDVCLTTNLDELAGRGDEGLKSGTLRAVVAVGGDGTASVVRNHVPLDVPLLIVPMGTENLLGRYLGQRTEAAAVCDTIEDGIVIDLDIGKAGGKYFLLMISAGFDAEVIRSLHENRRGNISHLSYFWPTLNTVRRYDYPLMRVYWDPASSPRPEPRECRWMFGFNFPLYALGLPIAPHALATDGALDVCTFERGAVWSVARYLWHIVRKMHLDLPDTENCQSRRFRLEAVDGKEVSYQVDGDFGGVLPVDVEVLPGKLRLLVSRSTAVRLGFTVPVACE